MCGILRETSEGQAGCLLLIFWREKDSLTKIETNDLQEELAQEIARRKEAEAARDEALTRLQTALAAGEVGTWTWDILVDRVVADKNMAHLFGVSEQEAAGGPIAAYTHRIHPEDRGRVEDTIRTALESGREYESVYRVFSPNGDIRWVIARGKAEYDANGTPIRLPGVVLDISARKSAEEALGRSEEMFRAAQETSVDGFMVYESIRDANGKIVDFRWEYANEASARILGRPRDWFIGRRLLDEMPNLQLEGRFASYVHVVETGEPWTHTFGFTRNDAEVYIRVVASRVGDGFAVTFADLTERRRMEEALRESEQQFRMVADTMPQLVWSTLPDGFHDYYNARWFEYTGLTFEQSQGEGWNTILHPDDQERAWRIWRHSLETGAPYEIEYRFRRHDGIYRWFIGRALPLRDDEGNIRRWFGTCTDVDDQKRTEETLRQNQEEIAGLNTRLRRSMVETHHRVKNNLQLMVALIEAQKSDTEELLSPKSLDRLSENVRALGVIHDLLTLEARQDGDASSLSARALLEQLIVVLERTVRGRRIAAELDDVRLPGKAATSLALVANELLANALKHGTGDVGIRFHRQNNIVTLEVWDDGPGFVDGFDPGEASNTGLALIENIVQFDFQGDISYSNRTGGGGSVNVTFPLPAVE